MLGFLLGSSPKPYSRQSVRNPVLSYRRAITLLKDIRSLHPYYQEAADCLDQLFAKVPELREDRSLHTAYANTMVQLILDEGMERPNKLFDQHSKNFATRLRDNPMNVPQPARDIIAYLLWLAALASLLNEDPINSDDVVALREARRALLQSVRYNEDNAAAHSDLGLVIGRILECAGSDEAEIRLGLEHCDRSLQLWEKNSSAYRVMSILYTYKGDNPVLERPSAKPSL
jgi:hypothetical protein